MRKCHTCCKKVGGTAYFLGKKEKKKVKTRTNNSGRQVDRLKSQQEKATKKEEQNRSTEWDPALRAMGSDGSAGKGGLDAAQSTGCLHTKRRGTSYIKPSSFVFLT